MYLGPTHPAWKCSWWTERSEDLVGSKWKIHVRKHVWKARLLIEVVFKKLRNWSLYFSASTSFFMLSSSRCSLSEYREYVWSHLIAAVPGSLVGGRPSWAQVFVLLLAHTSGRWHPPAVHSGLLTSEGGDASLPEAASARLVSYLMFSSICICDTLFWLHESLKNVLWFLQGGVFFLNLF